jgi:hypothetical protein
MTVSDIFLIASGLILLTAIGGAVYLARRLAEPASQDFSVSVEAV